MALVCPSCDVVPPADAQAGAACAACGSRLVVVPASTDGLIGTVLDGRFEILERLGAGAMGVVYRAKQLSIGRDVAVKVLAGIDSVDLVKRFFREAKIASALSHPNTVQIIEFGQGADGRLYLAMELVRGRTLLDEMNDGALASRRICRIGTQLCDALEAAHKLSIVHRDLKPENIMIADDGSDHVKVLDFGIARILGDASAQLTSAGLAAGTPNYMAPEVLGHAADPAPPQDMYALGVILGELALGEGMWPPMSLEMLYLDKTKNTAVERVPVRMRPLVRKLTSPDPSARPTAVEARRMLRDLDRTATDPVGVARTEQVGGVATSAGSSRGLELDLDLDPATLDLVSLDQRDRTDVGPPALDVAAPVPAQKAPTVHVPPPPMMTPAADVELKVDSTWEREREQRRANPPQSHAAKRIAAEARPAPRKKSGAPILLTSLLVIAALGGVAVYVVTQMRPPKPTAPIATRPPIVVTPERPREPPRPVDTSAPQPLPARGVSIRIIAAPGTPITIDGALAGKGTVSLKRTAGKKPMTIAAPGVKRTIVPDRDQTIDLTKP